MKKNILSLLAISLILGSCDYNDKYFDGLDDLTEPKDVSTLVYTLVDADYDAFVKNADVKALAAKKTEDEKNDDNPATNTDYTKELGFVATDKAFSAKITAEEFLPLYLKQKWFTKNNESTATVTYRYKDRVQNAETGKWENVFEDKVGLFVVLNDKWQYKDPALFMDDFEAGDVNFTGWINKQFLDQNKLWSNKAYSGNRYADISAYDKTGPIAKSEAWLITKGIHIPTDQYAFGFDVNVRNFAGKCFTVHISTDFDGNEANIKTATWVDVTKKFKIPEENMKEFAKAGVLKLDKYAGKKIYIAFVYIGASNGVTTTIQIDNVLVDLGVFVK